MMSSDKPSLNTRWLQRFEHFERAYTLLTEAISLSKTRPLSNLEAEGAIQRFEYTLELAWKTLKDYLEANNVVGSGEL